MATARHLGVTLGGLSIPARLRADLVTSLRARDQVETSMIRTLISAIENAEAVEATTIAEPQLGLNHDRPRRELTEADIVEILRMERAELAEATAHYRALGLDEATELERRTEIVDRYLP